MQTKPVYLEDAYQKTCTARIISVSESKIELDQTIFYPEGGGQPADQGTIISDTGELRVDHVSLMGDKIVHEGKLKGQILTGQKVKCQIDWERRYHNMQIHSAGHLIHEAVKLVEPKAVPIEGQHGKHAYIKYQGLLDQNLTESIKDKANELINKSLSIKTEFVSLEELKKRASWLPPKLPTNKPLRIMWLEGFEPIPDGGTQVKNINELPKISDITFETESDTTKVVYKLEKVSRPKSETAAEFTNFNKQSLMNLKNEALAQIISTKDAEEIERLRLHYLGKHGVLSQVAKEIPKLDVQDKIEAGRMFNDVKQALESAFQGTRHKAQGTENENLDLTLPGTPINIGILHPITAVAREMNDIFKQLGFSVADGPEIENDEFNYNRLNLPMDHPARDLQDSLYIQEPNILLRTHTSSIEAHILTTHKPPYRFVFPGKAYRYENVSASNHMMFYQYQGVAVGEGITMANLKWTLETFVKLFFGPDRKTRFRCKYYPEVEPGVGMDIDCQFCQQKGCSVCKQRGWVEMLGAGMIHANMLRKVNLDPQKYSGFAWGMGLDRITMSKYGINDIRALFNGDLIYKL